MVSVYRSEKRGRAVQLLEEMVPGMGATAEELVDTLILAVREEVHGRNLDNELRKESDGDQKREQT